MSNIKDMKNITIKNEEILRVIGDALYEPNIEKINTIIVKYNMNPQKMLFGYFERGKLIGIIGIEKKKIIVIEYIGVVKEKRKNGVGTKLIEFIKGLDQRDIYAETDDESMPFYRKYGFTIESKIKKYGSKEVKRYDCWIRRQES